MGDQPQLGENLLLWVQGRTAARSGASPCIHRRPSPAMNRRTFLAALGLAPLAPLAAKVPSEPELKPASIGPDTVCTWGSRIRIIRATEQVFLLREDGGWCAIAGRLPGAVSQGSTRSEALDNIGEAIEGLLESYADRGEPAPWKQGKCPPGCVEDYVVVTWPAHLPMNVSWTMTPGAPCAP